MSEPNISLDELAGKLTTRQRDAILSARWVGSGPQQMCVVDYTDLWEVPVARFLTLRSDCLNDLGIQLKNHLSALGGRSQGGEE